jgi:hypothetical protein
LNEINTSNAARIRAAWTSASSRASPTRERHGGSTSGAARPLRQWRGQLRGGAARRSGRARPHRHCRAASARDLPFRTRPQHGAPADDRGVSEEQRNGGRAHIRAPAGRRTGGWRRTRRGWWVLRGRG